MREFVGCVSCFLETQVFVGVSAIAVIQQVIKSRRGRAREPGIIANSLVFSLGVTGDTDLELLILL